MLPSIVFDYSEVYLVCGCDEGAQMMWWIALNAYATV